MKTYDIRYALRGTWTCRIRTIENVPDQATALQQFWLSRFGCRPRTAVVIDSVEEVL